MSSAIYKFVDTVSQAERTGSREIIMKLQDARALHGEITKLLSSLESMNTQVSSQSDNSNVEINGGSF